MFGEGLIDGGVDLVGRLDGEDGEAVDVADLEAQLQRGQSLKKGMLIVVDGLFSMMGDLAPLPEIRALADRYGARLEYLKVGDHFNPEVGFLQRDDFKRAFASLRFSPRPKDFWGVRKFTWQLDLEHLENGAGRLETRTHVGRFVMERNSSDQLTVEATRDYEMIVQPFPVATGISIAPGSYSFDDVQVTYTLGAQRRVQGALGAQFGDFWNGTIRSLSYTAARISVLKHPAWQDWVDERLRNVAPDAPEAAAWRRLGSQLAPPCDLSAAWTDVAMATGARPLPCSTLVAGHLHTLGTFDPWGPPVPPGVNRLPLVLLVNEETHSAAEQFAALLRDNRKARLVGSTTSGTACGTFTSRGTGFTLPHSGARVHVPDCVRLRADGSSERRGIAKRPNLFPLVLRWRLRRHNLGHTTRQHPQDKPCQ